MPKKDKNIEDEKAERDCECKAKREAQKIARDKQRAEKYEEKRLSEPDEEFNDVEGASTDLPSVYVENNSKSETENNGESEVSGLAEDEFVNEPRESDHEVEEIQPESMAPPTSALPTDPININADDMTDEFNFFFEQLDSSFVLHSFTTSNTDNKHRVAVLIRSAGRPSLQKLAAVPST